MTDKLLKILKGHLISRHEYDGIYPYQEDIAKIILDAIIQNLRLTANATEEDVKKLKRVDTGFEISRQAGKTTIVVGVIEFIMIYLAEQFQRPIRIGIFAPQKEQAKTDFDRLKLLLARDTPFTVNEDYADDEDRAKQESNARTIVLPNQSSCYIFPVTKTSKPESKTLDLIVYEEAQDLDDIIVGQQIMPMGASTNAPSISIGTAGTQICRFYRMGQTTNLKKIYFDEIVAQRRALYEQTGNALHLIYEQTVKQDIEKYGRDSDEIARPYFGKWLIGTGQFTTQDELETLITDRSRTHHEKKDDCFAGIDVAKHPDSTVVTILRYNKETQKKELINWLELRGDNYMDQFEIIHDFLKRYKIIALAIDATGVGDFLPDMFEKESNWQDENTGLFRVKFSAVSKDIMYKNLKVSIKEFLTTLPKLDTREGEKFFQQLLDLQQEYKGQLLSVSHPDDPNAHDDYPDSWALAEHAFARWNETSLTYAIVSPSEKERNVKKDDEGKTTDYWPGADW